MKALAIPAAVLLALFLLGQVRVGCRAEYNAQGAVLWLRLGAFRFQVFPWKGKKRDKPRKEKKKKPGLEPDRKPEERPREPAPQMTLGGALEYAKALLPIVLEAAGRFRRKLQVDALNLELTVGAGDPADAALGYGRANAVLGALWYPLTSAFRVKDGAARVKVDFDAQEMTLWAAAALSLKIGQILCLGLYFGLKFLRTVLAVRREQKKQQERKAA